MAILNGNKYTVPFGDLKRVLKKSLYVVYRYSHVDGKTWYFVLRYGKVLYKAYTLKECRAFIARQAVK